MISHDDADITVWKHRQSINRKKPFNWSSGVGQLVNARLKVKPFGDVNKAIAVAVGQMYAAVLAGNVAFHLKSFRAALALDSEQIEIAAGCVGTRCAACFPGEQVTSGRARSGRIEASSNAEELT